MDDYTLFGESWNFRILLVVKEGVLRHPTDPLNDDQNGPEWERRHKSTLGGLETPDTTGVNMLVESKFPISLSQVGNFPLWLSL